MALNESNSVETTAVSEADVERANASLPEDAKQPLQQSTEALEVEDAPRASVRTLRESGSTQAPEESLDTTGNLIPCCYRCCGVNFTVFVYMWLSYTLINLVSEQQALAILVLLLFAVHGAKKARPGPETYPRGSLESLYAEERSAIFRRYVRVMVYIEAPLRLRDFLSGPMGTNLLAAEQYGAVFMTLCAYGIFVYIYVHMRAKFFGDILLSLQSLATSVTPVRRTLNRVEAWKSRQDRGAFGERLLDMASRSFWWRVLFVYFVLALGNYIGEIVPDSKLLAASSLSRELGFTRIVKKSETEPFRKFIVHSWQGRASKDNPVGAKAPGVRVKLVIKSTETNSARLKAYKNAKEVLKRRSIPPIQTRWNPAHLHDWDMNDKVLRPGIRTTAVLQQTAVRPVLNGLADRNEGKLDSTINEAMLFHGTKSIAAVRGIMLGGFNIDLAGSSAGTLYGIGAYLADMASKSDDYAEELQNVFGLADTTKYMILCKTALGQSKRVNFDNRLATVGLNKLDNSKYADGHLYNEYLVADPAQAYCPYTVVYEDENDLLKHMTMAASYFCWAAHLVAAWTFRVNRYFPG
eukprot:TRINITY_DN4328_c0_g3_i1.p1 TRINITY_DN4328_c0_g3~~TRINITY_DN4328_c0_g3_i1.p1  ORF type:complete len:580 (-),score=62.67 TRINITY_DN4328_c0_g3_i1:260-1999(-)